MLETCTVTYFGIIGAPKVVAAVNNVSGSIQAKFPSMYCESGPF